VTTAAAHHARTLDCVHCGLCLPACPTYDVLGLETDSPRGRIYLMRALEEGRVQRPADVRVYLDRCLDCRACESACPSGVRYGELLEDARERLEATLPRRGLAARLRRWLLLRVLARQRRLRLAFAVLALAQRAGLRWLAAKLRLLPPAIAALPAIPPASERAPLAGTFPAHGGERGRVALLTGCVMEQLFGRVNRATIALLQANGFTVEVPRDQACCGALLVHDGLADAARALARRNVAAFAGAAAVVTNSAGCGAALHGYGHLLGDDGGRALAAKARDVSAFLAEHGLAAQPAPFAGAIAYDDPCHLCHGQGVRQQPRELLAQVPGARMVAHADPEACCGSAGIYNLVHPRLAGPIGRRKAAALAACGADVVATGNPGCMMQIAAHLRALGSPVRVVHPVELLLPAEARA
jgi:glycolate oxidase iron-sulfur subunit